MSCMIGCCVAGSCSCSCSSKAVLSSFKVPAATCARRWRKVSSTLTSFESFFLKGSWGPVVSGSCKGCVSGKVEGLRKSLFPVGADLSLKTVLPTKRCEDFSSGFFHLAPVVYQSLLRTIFVLKKVRSSARSSKPTGRSLVPSGEKKVAQDLL